ncbi:GntR family transcriptional regulator [Mesorhizobium sp. M1076]|uniref:GntR family transcriptional regulator n=1 Tax=Mesorhizobium sp. M1076 TaxID=2957054 RepID=UPI00333B2A1A
MTGSEEGSKPGKRGKPKGRGSQLIFDALREQILSVEIAPGADIDELGLVARYGVSRTPVREALIKLASEGLVLIVPNRGARVAPLEISNVPALLEALELCERAVNRFSALRHRPKDLLSIEKHCKLFEDASIGMNYNRMAEENRNFHEAIARSCDNRYIEEQYKSLTTMTMRLARMAFTTAARDPNSDGYYDTVRHHHSGMVEAIRHRDADHADELAKEHAKLFRGRLLKFLERNDADALDLGRVDKRD